MWVEKIQMWVIIVQVQYTNLTLDVICHSLTSCLMQFEHIEKGVLFP